MWIEKKHSKSQQQALDEANETLRSSFEFIMALARKYDLLRLPREESDDVVFNAGLAIGAICTATLISFQRGEHKRAYNLLSHLKAFTEVNFDPPCRDDGRHTLEEILFDLPPAEREEARMEYVRYTAENPGANTFNTAVPISTYILGMKPAVSSHSALE